MGAWLRHCLTCVKQSSSHLQLHKRSCQEVQLVFRQVQICLQGCDTLAHYPEMYRKCEQYRDLYNAHFKSFSWKMCTVACISW